MKLDIQQTKTTQICIGHEELKIENPKRCYQKFIKGEWREVDAKDIKEFDIFQDSSGKLLVAERDAKYLKIFEQYFIFCRSLI